MTSPSRIRHIPNQRTDSRENIPSAARSVARLCTSTLAGIVGTVRIPAKALEIMALPIRAI
jgi:hypothetical protein